MIVLRFLLDQCSDARLLAYLIQLGHDAKRIGRDFPRGLSDRDVLAIALREERILITDDRDFGEMVVRLSQPHSGVIFLRLGDSADLALKVARLDHVLTHHAHELDQFLVVTRDRVRARP
jgi:predicted nuclease of predicted toxin-antitoxin system